MTRPDVSVIIVSWNCRQHLLRCLRALPDALGDLSWEAIVVDNASEDGSAEAARACGVEARVIANEKNRLYTAAANQGLAAAQGRHLLLLNPDTTPHPQSLARLVAYADHHPQTGLLGPRILDPEGRDDLRTGRNYPTPWSECLDWLGLTRRYPRSALWAANLRPQVERSRTAAVPLLSGACLLLPERLPPELRRFDERFVMYGEDVDLSRRLQAAGFSTALVAEAVVEHVGGVSSRRAGYKPAVWAVEGVNRYFRIWEGQGAARRHRLAMALVAGVKWFAYRLASVLRWQPTLADNRQTYAALFRWAITGSVSWDP